MITILFNKYKQVRKHFGAILRYRCKFESYRTFQLYTTWRVLGKFSIKTSSSYTYKREKERDRMGKKRQIETCNVCGHKNDLTVIFENGDFEPSWREGYVLIYCEECGNTIEVRKR